MPLFSGSPKIPKQEVIQSGTLVTLTIRGVTDGGAERRIALPGKLNVKTGPQLTYISVLVLP